MNLKRGFLALAAMILGVGLFGASPAFAVTGCTAVTNLSAYPSVSGHLFNCMPTPPAGAAGNAERNFQTAIMGAVNAGVQHSGANKTLLQSKDTRFYVFYTGQQAFSQLGIVLGPNEPAVKPGETGRSWPDPAAQASLPSPTTAVFAFTATQWAANGNHWANNPVGLNGQATATTHHEIGHQMDRHWGQARTPAITSITVSDPKWGVAIGYDAGQISAADRNFAAANWPRLFVPNTTNWAPSEIFAVLHGKRIGGGTDSAEDNWVKAHFTCADWYTFYLNGHGGAQPANLDGASCYGHTN